MSIPCNLNSNGTITLTDSVSLPMPFGMDNLLLPAGFVSDGQSAPRGLWWLTGPPLGSQYNMAWLGHDWMCERAECWADRTVADGYLAWWLRQMGATRAKVWVTYLACLTYGRIKFLRRNGW